MVGTFNKLAFAAYVLPEYDRSDSVKASLQGAVDTVEKKISFYEIESYGSLKKMFGIKFSHSYDTTGKSF